jgi:hypothetical protein
MKGTTETACPSHLLPVREDSRDAFGYTEENLWDAQRALKRGDLPEAVKYAARAASTLGAAEQFNYPFEELNALHDALTKVHETIQVQLRAKLS